MKHTFGHDIIEKHFKADLILAAAVLMAALFLGILFRPGRQAAEWVVIRRDAKTVGRYALDEDRRVELEDDTGTNILVIQNKTVHMEAADCPDLLCVKQGSVSRVGESIICLPHRLVISIEGESDPDAPDAMVR